MLSISALALQSLFSVSASVVVTDSDIVPKKDDEVEHGDLWEALNKCIHDNCGDEKITGPSSTCFQQVCSVQAGACLRDEQCRLKATHGETLDTPETSELYGMVRQDLLVCAQKICPSFDLQCLLDSCGFRLSTCLFAKDCFVFTYCYATCEIQECKSLPQNCLPRMQCFNDCRQDTTIVEEAKTALANLITKQKTDTDMELAHDKDHFDVSDQVMSCVLRNCPSVNPSVKCLVGNCLGKIFKCTFSGLCLKMGFCTMKCLKPISHNDAAITRLDAVMKCASQKGTTCLDTMPPSFVCLGLYCAPDIAPCVVDQACLSSLNCVLNCLPEDVPPVTTAAPKFLKELPTSSDDKHEGVSEELLYMGAQQELLYTSSEDKHDGVSEEPLYMGAQKELPTSSDDKHEGVSEEPASGTEEMNIIVE